MREQYCFEESVKNPYLPLLTEKTEVILRRETAEKIRRLSEKTGFSFSHLTDLLLTQALQEENGSIPERIKESISETN